MSVELKELGQILDKSDNSDEEAEAIRTAIQALLFHQVIYDDMHSIPSSAISAIKNHRIFFEKYFAAAGFKLTMDSRSQMIALSPESFEKPPYGWRQMRLKKDESILRIALRYLFEKGMQAGVIDEYGRVPTDTIELTDIYQRMAKTKPPSENQLIDVMLRDLQRRGIVRVGDRDKDAKVTKITILPGVRILVSDEFVQRLEKWIEMESDKGFLDTPITVDEEEDANV